MIELLIMGAVSFLIGWKLREWYAMRMIRKIERRMHEAAEQPQIPTRHVMISREQSTLLVHDTATGEFLIQAETYDALKEALSKKYPDTNFMVDASNLRNLDLPLP